MSRATHVVADYQGTAEEWDEFVRGRSGWTHFHLYGWRGIMQRIFHHECRYLAVRDAAGRLEGVLPLVRVRSAIFGHYLVSMPFLNYGGPLGTAEAVSALAQSAVELAESEGVKLVELRSRIEQPLPLRVSHRNITVLRDLPEGGDTSALWTALGSKLRSQVKRPQKEGLVVRFGADQVAPFFRVFAHHMRDLGTPTQPLRFFEALAAGFGDDVWFGCVYHGDEPIACGCGFRWSNEFEMTWASSLVAYNRLAPNMLLYWAFMERAVQEQLRLFNFGRCTPDGGTHRFKRQWGSRDEPLWWYQWSRGNAAATPSPDAGAYSLGPRIWKRLPLGLATAIGPHIVRGIP